MRKAPGGALSGRPAPWAWPLLAALAAAVLLTGCGSQIDTEKAETEIRRGVERQTAGQAPVRRVECPEDVGVEEGATFECRVTGTNGRTVRVTVTQRDDEGNVSYSGDLQPLVQE